MLRKKNVRKYFYENFQNGGQVNFGKNIRKSKQKFFTGQGIKHVILDLAVPPRMQNRFQGPPTTRYTVKQRKQISELIFTKNTKISPQNGGENKSENYLQYRTNLNH